MNKDIKTKVQARLHRIEGQVRGLQKMVDNEEYCIDIITQSFAVKGALAGVEELILENHLSTHVAQQMRSGKQAAATKEILNIYKLSKKK
jgi:CsoR family transcriptional regulator, copper-sensing transcriptional repressor